MKQASIYKIADEIATKHGIYVSKSQEYRSLPPLHQKRVREYIYRRLVNASIG